MTKSVKATWLREFGLEERDPPSFFSDLSQLESTHGPAAQSHALRRAWQDLGLSGILCQDNVPLLYFKELPSSEPEILAEVQRKLWNHGVAPLLAAVTPTEVRVFSGLALPARPGEEVDRGYRLVEVLERVADTLEIRTFLRSVETGEVFRAHPRSFDPALRVDRYLLANLDAARRALANISSEVAPRSIHALLTRIVFVCYLVDRRIIEVSYFTEKVGATQVRNLADLLRQVDALELLFRLFAQLKRDFNGDLFGTDAEREFREIRPGHLEVIRRFLRGDKLESEQLSLGFWAYDFGVIPIETISGIYERFLEAEDASSRRREGAFYTPRFLAEAVLDIALEGEGSLLEKRFLDPSCGSGIFLVALFHRIAEEWTRSHPEFSNEARATGLIEILRQSIFGVDRNETACRISAFSLYLALLDQLSPRDIQVLQERGTALPRLLADPQKSGEAFEGNIVCSDFFRLTPGSFPAGGFNLVIGNPPWGSARGVSRELFEMWCAEQDLPVPGRQIAQAFVWKAACHTKSDGRVCFLLPASLLFNQGRKVRQVQALWFRAYRMERIVNLSDMRFYLFDGPVHPAVIVRYRKALPGPKDELIYETPKTSWEMLKAEALTVAPEDVATLPLGKLVQELQAGRSSTILKESFWGTPRDLDLLDRLRGYPTLGDREVQSGQGRPWILREGFNKGGAGEPREREILRRLKFLPTSGVTRLVVRRSALQDRPPTSAPRRLGNEKIYRAPHVLFPHGGRRIGFANFDCSFEHTVRGLHADRVDSDQLRFLTCVLSSRLADYFLFHTSASWGIERQKVHVQDYREFPFPEPNTAERKSIVQEVASAHMSLERIAEEVDDLADRVKALLIEIEPLVFKYYDLDAWEEVLVRDTVESVIPSTTPTRNRRVEIPLLRQVHAEDRLSYLDLLLEALNTWSSGTERRVQGEILLGSTAGLGIVCLQRSGVKSLSGEREAPREIDQVLQRIAKVLRTSRSGLSLFRNLKVFDGDDLYLVKPLVHRSWLGSMALNDADEIAAAILREAR